MPFRSVQRFVALVAAVPLLLPVHPEIARGDEHPPVTSAVRAARPAPATEATRPIDVILANGQVLQGRIVNSQGVARGGTEITVVQGRESVAHAVANDQGEFQTTLPKGGLYLIKADQSALLVRAWTPAAAPPHALAQIRLTERPVLRGQDEDCPPEGRDHGKGLMLLALTGALAAAIVIPLVLIDELDDDKKSSSP